MKCRVIQMDCLTGMFSSISLEESIEEKYVVSSHLKHLGLEYGDVEWISTKKIETPKNITEFHFGKIEFKIILVITWK